MTKLNNLLGPKDAPKDDSTSTRKLMEDSMFTWGCELCELTFDDNTQMFRAPDGYACCESCLEQETRNLR